MASNAPNTKVRMLGCLHTIRRTRGLAPCEAMYIPPEGMTGFALACELDLPLDKIEAVFINNSARPLDELIRPGDKVAFIFLGDPPVPVGTDWMKSPSVGMVGAPNEVLVSRLVSRVS